ncbi:MAG: DUF302 domain-containing protein [Myxococcales bacterium]|nr:MAG: DUF302 domain-containing protein [Myxococcales bacterium]
MASYTLQREVPYGFDETRTKVVEALKVEGFGVLTEIDVKDTLKKKIDVEFRPYTILGACNPKLAHKALGSEEEIGVLLPCNVCLSQIDSKTTRILAMDPVAAMGSFSSNTSIQEVASEVKERLERVLESI